MHEISIMQGALDLAEYPAREGSGTIIVRMRLRVGLLSGVVPEALEFAFEVLKKGTMAENAVLEIERVPSEFRCSVCKEMFRFMEIRFDCPACSGMLVVGSSGTDLELSDLEIT